MAKLKPKNSDDLIILDRARDGSETSEIIAHAFPSNELAELVGMVQVLRCPLRVSELGPEQAAALRGVSEAALELRSIAKPDEKAVAQDCELGPSIESLGDQLDTWEAERALVDAFNQAKECGLSFFGSIYQHWSKIEFTYAYGDQDKINWGSTDVGAIVVSNLSSETIKLQVNVGTPPPPVAPPGGGDYVVDGRKLAEVRERESTAE